MSTLGREPELPALARRYLARVLPSGGSVPRRVRVAQEGEMWLKRGGRALPFTAVEDFSVGEVAFSWRARFRFLPVGPTNSFRGFCGRVRFERERSVGPFERIASADGYSTSAA